MHTTIKTKTSLKIINHIFDNDTNGVRIKHVTRITKKKGGSEYFEVTLRHPEYEVDIEKKFKKTVKELEILFHTEEK